ncbi:MAG: hypothetical protein WD360_05105 [Nitriliruptoraceae bacterium]
MSDTRPRLIAYAPARSPWSARCARWAADARIPFAYLRCVTLSALVDELVQGKPHAILVDARACTQQVVAAAIDARVPLIGVGGDVDETMVNLSETFRREELLHLLVSLQHEVTPLPIVDTQSPCVRRRVVAVIGSGGAGTSTVAGLLAQGLSGAGEPVLLADLCRNASQAVLHDVKHQIDGVMEMAAVADHAKADGDRKYLPLVEVAERGYDLVLGMRQPLQWVSLRGDRANRVIATLRDGDGWLVCDVDADLDTQQDTGSVGVGDRHRFTTDVLAYADVVVLVADASLMGVFRGVELCAAVVQACRDTVPIVAVINRARKGAAFRRAARFTAAFEALALTQKRVPQLVSVVSVPVFGADQCHLAVTSFPTQVVATLSESVVAVMAGER